MKNYASNYKICRYYILIYCKYSSMRILIDQTYRDHSRKFKNSKEYDNINHYYILYSLH